MKKSLNLLGAVLLAASTCLSAHAQATHEKGPWRKTQESAFPKVGTRYILPTKYLTFRLNIEKIQQQLSLAKLETDPTYVPVFIELPKPDGTFGFYRVYENTTMAPELAANFPEIRAFDGVATDGSGEVVKLDLTPQGFHAMILSPAQPTMFIDPYSHGGGDIESYIVYSRADFVTDKRMECQVDTPLTQAEETGLVKSYGNCQKRTYSLAVAATGEYTTFQGGTVALAQAAQVTTVNRVNGVYMRDLAVTLTIVGNNNLLIYTNASTDPYTNGTPGTMINQNQTNVTSVIGSANYDIGHVFGTNSGGLAGLGVVCSNGQKAGGVTGSAAPVGDPFDIDYVAHEMGHQFSGNHSFRANSGSCSGNANAGTAMEPGSGSTIMAYAGICSPQDLQPNSDDYFHGVNMAEMHTFLLGSGNGCATGTTIPAQSSPSFTSTTTSVTIPAGTPFALTAVATDPDGDVLTYCWEQMDNQFNPTTAVQPPTATNTGGPSFRSFDPSTSGTRYFPSIATLMANGPFTWERLPTVTRAMNFRCVVRDNEVNGGCNDDANVVINTTSAAGPFLVNYPTATGVSWPGNSTQTVTWAVANTNVAPVSCANVDIIISLDGGATFTTLLAGTPNDGSEAITVPNTASTTAIIMVMCANGTFFDVSNNVFTITAATNDYTLALVNNAISACQGANAQYSVTVGQIGSYSNPVTLSAAGLPGGVTAVFSPNPATPGTSSTLTISNTAAAAAGTYSFTVNGTSAAGPHSTPGTLSITTSTSVVSTLVAPANAAPQVYLPAALSWTNPNAGMTFDVQIATDAAFTNIVESATGLTSPNYSATTLTAATTYFWRVNSYNSCSSAGNSSAFSFTTASCQTYNSTNIPVVISPTNAPTIASTIVIPTGGTINDLNVVNIAGTHTWVSDLTFTLTSPAGTTRTLISNICGDAIEDFDFIMDDQAASATLPCPPTDGNAYQPEQLLSLFNGENMSGTWTLTVADGFNQDGGSLNSWGLQICFTPSAPCTNPDVPSITGTTSFCAGTNTALSVGTGNLNDATAWHWYSGTCGGTAVGTGATIPVSAAGTYFVRGEGGCVNNGTCQSVTVTQLTVNTNTTLSNGVISASQSGGVYQWVDCNSGNAPISGATSQTFDPIGPGSYAVTVTAPNGCMGTSACVNYSVAGMNELENFAIQLYPNPTTGMMTVQFAENIHVDEMNVTDVTGRIVRLQNDFTAETIQLDLSKESKGVYFLNVRVGTQLQTLKITKN